MSILSIVKMNCSILFLLLLLILLGSLSSCTFGLQVQEEEDSMLTKYHIHIINDLPENSSTTTLLVHCKSADKDLGFKEVGVHEEFVWMTRVNFFRTTLYFCFTKWGVKERYIVAFKAKRDQVHCKKFCLWLGREDGFYFSSDNTTWTIAYPW